LAGALAGCGQTSVGRSGEAWPNSKYAIPPRRDEPFRSGHNAAWQSETPFPTACQGRRPGACRAKVAHSAVDVKGQYPAPAKDHAARPWDAGRRSIRPVSRRSLKRSRKCKEGDQGSPKSVRRVPSRRTFRQRGSARIAASVGNRRDEGCMLTPDGRLPYDHALFDRRATQFGGWSHPFVFTRPHHTRVARTGALRCRPNRTRSSARWSA